MIKDKKKRLYEELPFFTIGYDRIGGRRFYVTKSNRLSNEKYEQYKSPVFVPQSIDELYYYVKFQEFNLTTGPNVNDILERSSIFEKNIINRLTTACKSRKIRLEKHEDIWIDRCAYEAALLETRKDFISLRELIDIDLKKLKIPEMLYREDLVCFKHIKDELDELKHLLDEKSCFKILIGEPGTGKTEKAIKMIEELGCNAMVASLSNLVGANFKARFEGCKKKGILTKNISCNFESYTRARFYPEYADTVIFEEASMLSSNELHIMLNLIRSAKNVIFCGDTNQLPGFLGLGNILYGLLKEYPDNVIKLTKNHRCSQDVVETMHAVLDTGEFPTPCMFDEKDAEKIYNKLLDSNEETMQVSFSNSTVDELNARAIRHLSELDTNDTCLQLDTILVSRPIPLRSKENFKVKNDGRYDYVFYNGEMCTLEKNGEEYVVSGIFKGHSMKFSWLSDVLEHFELGYAMTIHKSQGLEFKHVFYYESGNSYYETRNLAYVGYTRSKEKTYVVGNLLLNDRKKITYRNIFR